MLLLFFLGVFEGHCLCTQLYSMTSSLIMSPNSFCNMRLYFFFSKTQILQRNFKTEKKNRTNASHFSPRNIVENEKQAATVATASNLPEWTLSRRVRCKGTSCSRTRHRVMTFRVARCKHAGGHEGIQWTQMGCVRNSNPGTNRHEPLCVWVCYKDINTSRVAG